MARIGRNSKERIKSMTKETRKFKVGEAVHEVDVIYYESYQEHRKADAKEAEQDWARGHKIEARARALEPIAKAARKAQSEQNAKFAEVGKRIAERLNISEDEVAGKSAEELILLAAQASAR